MAKKKSFADDGWAIWVTGDDTSTFYLNQWVNPRGKSYVDIAVRIRRVRSTGELNIYIPFEVKQEEIQDLAFHLQNETIFRAIFSTRCIMDYMKNQYTSEMAYHGKTVDLIHLSEASFRLKSLSHGTLMTVSMEELRPYLDNDEAYLMFRVPHKSLDEVFKPKIDVENFFSRLRDLITSPVVSERYACSVRVNEARLLPDEINQIGSFHRQKLNKTVVTMSINEDYQVNDSNCYRIHRLEKELYVDYAPEGFDCDDAITYEWNESRERNLYGHYNFYFSIARDSVSKSSMFVYMILLLLVGLMGDCLSSVLGL